METPTSPRSWLWAKILGGLLFAGLAGLIVASLWVRWETAGFLYPRPSDTPAREVAIVPGASVHRSGKPSPVVEARLHAALELLRTGKVEKILVTGDHRPDQYDEAEAMQRWLIKEGVPTDKVLVDRAGVRTFESMARAASVFHVQSATVCTQGFHLPRAVFLARRAGVDAVGTEVRGDDGVYDLVREALATARALVDARSLAAKPAPAATTTVRAAADAK